MKYRRLKAEVQKTKSSKKTMFNNYLASFNLICTNKTHTSNNKILPLIYSKLALTSRFKIAINKYFRFRSMPRTSY